MKIKLTELQKKRVRLIVRLALNSRTYERHPITGSLHDGGYTSLIHAAKYLAQSFTFENM